MTKIALFGTSADPPTAGHLAILKWLSDRYDYIAVWASDNPFKHHQSALTHRMTMLRLLIEEIDTPKANIHLWEELSDRRSLISVEKAQQIWGKEADYFLVIGSDLIEQIQHWFRIEELLKKVTILVVPRPGYPLNSEALERLIKLGGNYEIANLAVPAVSSTSYRKYGNGEVVTPPILDYIHREQLYA